MLKERKCPRCQEIFTPDTQNQQICDKEHFKKCASCGKDYPWAKRGKTCSSQCASDSRRSTKMCGLCGKEFTGPISSKYCTETHYKKCEVCGKEFAIPKGKESKKNPTCGPSCGAAYSHNDSSKETRRKNSINKYGVPFVTQDKKIKAKIKHSQDSHPENDHRIGSKNFNELLSEKYDVVNVSQLDFAKNKKKETSVRNYGVDNPMKSKEVRAAFNKTMLDKYGVNFPIEYPAFREKMMNTYEKNSNLGLHKKGRISEINRSVAKKIEEEFGVKCSFEKRVDNYFFDLYAPEQNLLIDVHPTISHNNLVPYTCVMKSCDLPCLEHKPVDKNYHFNRAMAAKDNGYNLIQLYDWDMAKVIQLLDGKMGHSFSKVSARKCTVASISQSEANIFLNDNHIQGGTKKQKYCYGLFNKNHDELLAVATFGKSRFGSSVQYEFIRYAVKSKHIVHGGANKLFRSFLSDAEPESIISYVDFDHTTGNVFLNGLGFNELKETGPSLMWYNPKTDHNVSNNGLLIVGADRLLKTSYGSREESGLNNQDIMIKEGFFPIYNSGNRVFVWSKPESD